MVIQCALSAHQGDQFLVSPEGQFVLSPDTSGYIQQSPWLGIADKQLELVDRYMVELGLTPAARSRVSVAPARVPHTPVPVTMIGGRSLSDYSTEELSEMLRHNPKGL
jgi:hypothetical protein